MPTLTGLTAPAEVSVVLLLAAGADEAAEELAALGAVDGATQPPIILATNSTATIITNHFDFFKDIFHCPPYFFCKNYINFTK
jgi:hypothetical protein